MAPFEWYIYNYLTLIVVPYYDSVCLSLCSLADFLILFYRRQSSFVVVPPYWYVAPAYLLCFSLLRKQPGCIPTLPILELIPRHLSTSFTFFFSCTHELPVLQPLCFQIHRSNGGYGVPYFFGVRTFRPADVSMCFRAIPFLFTLLRTHLHILAAPESFNSFIFNRLRTLCKKTRGVG